MRSSAWGRKLLLPAVGLLALAAGQARAETCSPLVPLVTIEMASPVIVRDDTLSMAELGGMQAKLTMVSAADRAVFGLTESTRDARLILNTSVEVQARGSYCVRLQRVRVVITPKIRVHLARETLRDACFSDHVLAHELRHVELETTAARGEAGAVTAELQRYAARIPGRLLGPGAGQQPWLRELIGQIGGELRRISTEMAAARQIRHKAEVDDPDSGSALGLCDGFGRQLVDSYRQQIAAATPTG
jgi:hypothetical protein